MTVKTMTVTKLRSNIFEVVEATKINKQITNIMLHGEVVAEIRPKKVKKFDWVGYKKILDEASKRLSKYDWSDVLEVRKRSNIRRYKGW